MTTNDTNKVTDEVLNELCENFAATMWATGMSESTISVQAAFFKSRCSDLGNLTAKHLASIKTNIAFWFLDLPDDEGEKFTDAVELLTTKLDALLAERGRA